MSGKVKFLEWTAGIFLVVAMLSGLYAAIWPMGLGVDGLSISDAGGLAVLSTMLFVACYYWSVKLRRRTDKGTPGAQEGPQKRADVKDSP